MLTNFAKPWIAALLTSRWLLQLKRFSYECYRKVFVRHHPVTFYYSCYDPYSHLTAQVLAELVMFFDVKLKIVIVGATNQIDEPAHINYALRDCQQLSKRYQLSDFSNSEIPSQAAFNAANNLLLSGELTLERLIAIGQQLWCQPELLNMKQHPALTTHLALKLKKNTAQLLAKGHFQSAVLHYGHEWYWGLDRLSFLTQRLKELNACKMDNRLLDFGSENSQATNQIRKSELIDVYISFRSPYSYIALCKLARQPNLNINLKPILPMVMRGMELSQTKKMCILLDAARVAHASEIPFGKIRDPLGQGIHDCINLFYFANTKGKSLEMITELMTGIWSQGLDVNDRNVLKSVVEGLDLNWQQALDAMSANHGVHQAHVNSDDLAELGLWGVPSFKVGQTIYWGQDRFKDILSS
ncbi:MAG: DsbA family protein [Psychrobium sp.]